MIKEAFKITLKVSTQKDFDKLRALALFSEVIDIDELNKFLDDTFDEYYIINPALEDMKETVRKETMKEIHIDSDIYEWWYMYCYASVMGWAYNSELPGYDVSFENTSDVALRKLEKTISNKSIEMIRAEHKILAKEVINNPPKVRKDGEILTLHVQFVWQSREDSKVCSKCNELEGQVLMFIPEKMPHLNCRCDFLVYEWWTNPSGKVVADRRYEIEQNKQAKGYGYSIKQAKVVSKMEGGEQITIFEVLKDGTTTRKTYKEPK